MAVPGSHRQRRRAVRWLGQLRSWLLSPWGYAGAPQTGFELWTILTLIPFSPTPHSTVPLTFLDSGALVKWETGQTEDTQSVWTEGLCKPLSSKPDCHRWKMPWPLMQDLQGVGQWGSFDCHSCWDLIIGQAKGVGHHMFSSPLIR